MSSTKLRIAVAKGRIFKEALPLLTAAGIEPLEDPDQSRKLILPTSRPEVELVIIRTSDVPTYVQYGAADMGISGKDTLLEHGGEGLYEPLDLEISPCKLMVCGYDTPPPVGRRMRIATKYTGITRRYYAARGEQVELIKLYGSMELGPIVGLSDRIVDLVDTGNTLKANGLVPLELICEISSRLVVNKASLKLKHRQIMELLDRLETAVAQRRDSRRSA